MNSSPQQKISKLLQMITTSNIDDNLDLEQSELKKDMKLNREALWGEDTDASNSEDDNMGDEFDEETLITGHDIGSDDLRAPDSRTSKGEGLERRSDVLGGDEIQRIERLLFGEINDFGYELST